MKTVQNQAKPVSKQTWRNKVTYVKKNWLPQTLEAFELADGRCTSKRFFVLSEIHGAE